MQLSPIHWQHACHDRTCRVSRADTRPGSYDSATGRSAGQQFRNPVHPAGACRAFDWRPGHWPNHPHDDPVKNDARPCAERIRTVCASVCVICEICGVTDLYQPPERLTDPPCSSSWRASTRRPRLALPQAAKPWMPTFVGMTRGARSYVNLFAGWNYHPPRRTDIA
jgi:hypothetical protein